MRFLRFPALLTSCALVLVACGGKIAPEERDGDAGTSLDAHVVDTGSEPDVSMLACPPSLPTIGTPCPVENAVCDYRCGVGDPAGHAECSHGRWDSHRLKCADAGPPLDAEPPPLDGGSLTTGEACMSDDECDVTGSGTSLCSATAFTNGPLDPTPACFSIDCTPGTRTFPKLCDGNRGLCLSAGSTGLCLGLCTFDLASGSPPTGCIGKDACNAYGMSPDGDAHGVGYCIGGCRGGDCPSGSSCQVESGFCVKSPSVYSKKLGDACTSADAMPPAKCNCFTDAATKTGYCTTFCQAGITACPGGFVCDPLLPVKSTAVPYGIAGACLRQCSSDAECAGGTHCRRSPAMTVSTCQPDTPAL